MGGSKTDPGIFINWSLRLGTTASTCITFDKFWPISRDLVFDIRTLELWVVNEAIMKRRNVAKRDFYSTVVMWNRLGKHKANVNEQEYRLIEHRDGYYHNGTNHCRQSTNYSPVEVHETEQRHFETSNTSLPGVNTLDDDFLFSIKNRLAGVPPLPGVISLKPEPDRFGMPYQKSSKPRPYVVTVEPTKPKKVPTPVATQVDDSMITELKHQGTSTSNAKVASPFTQSVLDRASHYREGTAHTAQWHPLSNRLTRDDEGYRRSSNLEHTLTPQHDSHRMNRIDEGFQRASHFNPQLSFPSQKNGQYPRPIGQSQDPHPIPGFQSQLNEQSHLHNPKVQYHYNPVSGEVLPKVRSDVTITIHQDISRADDYQQDSGVYPQDTIEDSSRVMSAAQMCTCGGRELNLECFCNRTMGGSPGDYETGNAVIRTRMEFKEKRRQYKEARAEDKRRKKEERRRRKEEARARKREIQNEKRKKKAQEKAKREQQKAKQREQRAREKERRNKEKYESKRSRSKGGKTNVCSCCKCHNRGGPVENKSSSRIPPMQSPRPAIKASCSHPEYPCPAYRQTGGNERSQVRMGPSPSCGDHFCPYVLMSTTHRSCTWYQPQTIQEYRCSQDVTALSAQIDTQPRILRASPDRSGSPSPTRTTSAQGPAHSGGRSSSLKAARDASRYRDVEAAPAVILPKELGRGDGLPNEHSASPDRTSSSSPTTFSPNLARHQSAHSPSQLGARSNSKANTGDARNPSGYRDIGAAPAMILPNKVGRGDTSEALQSSGRLQSESRFSSTPADNVLIDLSKRGRESGNKRYVPPCVLYLDCTKVKDLCVIIKDKYEDP